MYDGDIKIDFLEIDASLLETSNEVNTGLVEEKYTNALVNEKTSAAFNQLLIKSKEENLFEAHGEITTHWFLSDAPNEGYEFVLNR